MIWNEMEYNKKIEDKFEIEPDILENEDIPIGVLTDKNFIKKIIKGNKEC